LLPPPQLAPAPLQICNGAARVRTNKQLKPTNRQGSRDFRQQGGEVNAKTTAWSFQAMMYEKQESGMPWEAKKSGGEGEKKD
jgi:hypothetical protein